MGVAIGHVERHRQRPQNENLISESSQLRGIALLERNMRVDMISIGWYELFMCIRTCVLIASLRVCIAAQLGPDV